MKSARVIRHILSFFAALAFGVVALECAQPVALLTCPDGQEGCAGVCVALASDSENCGKCGATCASGQACVKGACALTCPDGNLKCDRDGGASTCVNAKTDNQNCGKCGNACPSGQLCTGGACSGTCGDSLSGQTVCKPDAGDAYCANLKADGQNCGKCGLVCAGGTVCASGVCQSTCAPEQSRCGGDAGACVNLQTDNANCGACGAACGTLESCTAGVCVSACGPEQRLCGGDGGAAYCVDALSDNLNCGACGATCSQSKPVCSGGKCVAIGGGGTVRDVGGVILPVTYVKCGNGTNSNCNETTAESSCTGIGLKLVSHASNGTNAVVSLGATASCNWSISYFTNNDPSVSGQCLVGVSNAQWSNCCGVGSWHGNIVTVPVALGQQFGYVSSSNSGYNGALTNLSGTTWGCTPNSGAVPARGGCSTYFVACK
jgi:hypothetical protein